jgi:hypothetical protein
MSVGAWEGKRIEEELRGKVNLMVSLIGSMDEKMLHVLWGDTYINIIPKIFNKYF